ncbi:MAG TPA: hypothetical protein VLW85_00095 [Myxococcales bacterium]|nr:hypothetical protein [Myxococcales bacterium]
MILLLVLLAPVWAQRADTADASGHVFTCEGQGSSEDDALAAAQGICNDKICKVCGVEVESITETRETLTGVDLQRKVVERCRRVRKADTKLRAKSVDCDPAGGCTAWVQIFYSADDQKQECNAYTKEDFTDPAECEKDVQAFRVIEGHAADAFRARADALNRAMIHCAKIDVRPTPALLALDEKIKAGLAQFEWTQHVKETFGDDEYRPVYGWWLGYDEKLHAQIAESKLLIARLELARDYVANRALVFDVIEALDAKDADSPPGVLRIRDALLKAPVGKQYGTRWDIHFSAAGAIYRWKSDTTPLDEAMRKLYRPDDPDVDAWSAAKLFAQKGRVTAADWDWVFAAHKAHYCGVCVRTLLQVPQHEGGSRVDRALAAVATIPPDKRNPAYAYWDLISYGSTDLALDLEPRIPPDLRAQAYTWKYVRELVTRLYPDRVAQDVRMRGAAYAAKVLASDPKVDCTSLAAEIKTIAFNPAVIPTLDARTCSCLTGELRNEVHLVNRSDLLDHARSRKLGCIKGLPED